MIRIVTDSGADITKDLAEELNVDVVYLSVHFNDGAVDYTTEEEYQAFYKRMERSKELPKTSAPSPGAFKVHFEEAIKAGDELICICMSSGLSSTYSIAKSVADELNDDKIHVIDSHQLTMSQQIIVELACKMRDEGKSAQEIEDWILENRDRPVLFGVLDSLYHLSKSGRVSSVAAAMGTILRIKPLLMLEKAQGIVPVKVRGRKAGLEWTMEKFESEGYDDNYPLYVVYSKTRALAESFYKTFVERFNLKNVKIKSIGPITGTHVGQDAVGLVYVRSVGFTAKLS